MKKGKLLNIALSIAFINILFVCFSIINVNAEEDTDTLNTKWVDCNGIWLDE